MTEQDKNKTITDNEFDEYLSGNSDVSSLYHAADESNLGDALIQPGIDIDNNILAAAKREVAARPQKIKKSYSPFSNNYFISLSTAASIIIVVALVSFFPEQTVPPVEVRDVSPKAASPAILEEQQQVKIEPEITPAKKIVTKNKELAKRSVVKKQKKELNRKRQVKAKQKSVKLLSVNSDTFEQKIKQDEVESITSDSAFIGHLFNPVVKKKQQFDEKIWASLPETEWRRRIKKIYLRSGKLAVKDIIVAYNKKFPKKKISIKDIILNDKN